MNSYYVVTDCDEQKYVVAPEDLALFKSRKETQGPLPLFEALTIVEKDKATVAGSEAYWESIKDRFTSDVCGGSDYPEDSVESFLKPYIIAAFAAGRDEK